jgi:hypothetical protein
MSRRTDRQGTFSPLRSKTLFNVLRHLFATQFGYQDKLVFAEVMIERILETVDAFTKPAAVLKPGQLLWMAVANDGSKHAHKPMQEIPQVPVVLDLVTDEDLKALADGHEFRLVRRQRHARLLDQAFAQNGVLAQGDLAALTLTPRSVVGHNLSVVQKTEQRILPYRGSVHDIGATLTHKIETIRLLEAGFLEPEICHMLPVVHDLPAVENYVQTYKNVIKLLERGFAPDEVARILSIDRRLVTAYIEIIRQHHPEILARNPYLHEPSRASGAHPPEGHMS